MSTYSIHRAFSGRRIHALPRYLILCLSLAVTLTFAVSPLLIAGMLGDSSADKQAPYIPLQHATPVVQDGNGDIIGVFAGITAVPADSERVQAAFLTISTSGYLLPLLPDGGVVALNPLYFLSEDCSGAPYAESSAPTGSYPAHPGLVFRMPAGEQLYYISRYAEPVTMESRSKWQLQENGHRQCVEQVVRGDYLEVIRNSAVTTEIHSDCCAGPVAVKILNYREPPQPSPYGDTKEWRDTRQESLQDDEPVEPIYECSPGCSAADMGDGSCDISCYNDACRFDDGDCDKLNEDELRKEFGKLCTPGCFKSDIGDGFCDAACNVPACSYDGGDCEAEAD